MLAVSEQPKKRLAKPGFARLAGSVLGWLVGSVLRVRRRHVLSALAVAGFAEPKRIANGMYRALGTGLCEFLGLLRVRHELGDVEGLAAIERALGGRAAVVATAHTGNWDLVACAVAQATSLTVVTKRLSVGRLDRLWQRLRSARSVELLSEGIARGAARALSSGRYVAMMIDQAPERRRGVIVVEFLGQLAEVDLGPALVAMRAHKPLVVAFPRRTPSGHELQLAGVLEPPDRPSRAWATLAMTQATLWLEEQVRREPEQWLWMHRRWKRTPAVVPAERLVERAAMPL